MRIHTDHDAPSRTGHNLRVFLRTHAIAKRDRTAIRFLIHQHPVIDKYMSAKLNDGTPEGGVRRDKPSRIQIGKAMSFKVRRDPPESKTSRHTTTVWKPGYPHPESRPVPFKPPN
jgi:hypothetical protein